MLDLNGLTRDVLEGRLGRADVWWVTGGNQFHLAQSIARVDFPLYLLDDDSAIRVRGDKVDVVSTGRWRLVGP